MRVCAATDFQIDDVNQRFCSDDAVAVADDVDVVDDDDDRVLYAIGIGSIHLLYVCRKETQTHAFATPPNLQRPSIAILFRYMCDRFNSNIILYTLYGVRDRFSAHKHTRSLHTNQYPRTLQSPTTPHSHRAHKYGR